MAQVTQEGPLTTSLSSAAQNADEELLALRQILLGAEYDDLLRLKAQMEDPAQRSEVLAKVISEAIAIRVKQDSSIADALGPTIEGALSLSISSNPKALADVLYPVMGPAIRKSIRETMSHMFESFNRALEQSLSPRALRWRFDAWRTGKQYSEIVILNTMLFQVEQVFLIHKETGLLLHHITSATATTKDPDMVSGMLTAIQDFVSDSFTTSSEDQLSTMSLGGLTVLIEQGPQAVIATAVRGEVTRDYRSIMISALEDCHLHYSSELKKYDGDNTVFDDLDSILRPCLKVVELPDKPKNIWPGIAIVATIVISAGLLLYFDYQRNQAWQNAINTLENEPGIIIFQESLGRNNSSIVGLADPLARKPEEILFDIALPETTIHYSWQPYLSMEPTLIEKRLTSALELPANVTMSISDQELSLHGTAEMQWLNQVRAKLPLLVGIDTLNTDNLIVVNTPVKRLNELVNAIDSTGFYFSPGSTTPAAEDSAAIHALARQIDELVLLADSQRAPLQINVTGSADASGSVNLNRKLARERASNVVGRLVESGVPNDLLSLKVSVPEATAKDTSNQERKVTFQSIVGSTGTTQ